MIGKYAASIGLKDNALNPRIYYVPLMFWFCRNPGLSLPLIALISRAEKQSVSIYVDIIENNPVRIPQLVF
jgi:hypothetical protein